jgi:hypothetical protein
MSDNKSIWFQAVSQFPVVQKSADLGAVVTSDVTKGEGVPHRRVDVSAGLQHKLKTWRLEVPGFESETNL